MITFLIAALVGVCMFAVGVAVGIYLELSQR